MTEPARPHLVERRDRQPRHAVEEFMVPLLKSAVTEALRRWAFPVVSGGGRLLDVGCGGQPFRELVESCGARYLSADVAATSGVAVDFLFAIDGDLPPAFSRELPVDALLCIEVLEHVASWSRAFANFAAIVRPGGVVVLTAPHFYILHETPYGFWRPTVHAFDAFAGAHGFDVVTSEKLGGPREVLGTLLGATMVQASRPTLVRRLMAKGLRILKELVRRRLLGGGTERWVSLTGETYLANLVVLVRRSAS